jgi:glutathione synthase/RimK-type ligase-like ATP-grasp enzyme
MRVLFVVDRPQQWPFEIPGSGVVTAHAYLTDAAYSNGIEAQVVNLCRADRYQGRGYYVSLLAEARGHRPMPDVKTVEDLHSDAQVRAIAAQVQELAQGAIQHRGTDLIELDAYFGGDPAGLHGALAQQLFTLAKAPLLRAHFRRAHGEWRLEKIAAIGVAEVPARHRAFLLEAATRFVTGDTRPAPAAAQMRRPCLAILRDPQEVDRPSNDEALRKFIGVAPVVGLRAELIGPDDIEQLPGFDALFIRTTTSVNHYTYEFARRAESLGLPVIEDPESIVRCTNKVYLGELMAQHRIPTPRTITVHRDNLEQVVPQLGLPCILKQPDGGFGLGVQKIESEEQLTQCATQLFANSELLVAQEWLPTEFDWRVGVFDGRPLFVAQYRMAPGHWQIIKRDEGERVDGETVAMSVGEAPEVVISTAVRAANLIGSGLYGVDLKQSGDNCYVIEINDNPNIDAGNEDQVLGDALYREILGVFARRIREKRKVTSTTTASPPPAP